MAHSEPAGECLCCFEDLEKDNYCEYRSGADKPWKPAKYCADCIRHLRDTQFENYINGVNNSTCEAELARYMKQGPPIYIADKHALPVEDEGEQVQELWFASSDTVESGKLKGALEGAERQALWDSQKAFVTERGPGKADDAEVEAAEQAAQ